jgi:hypothetical protein
MGGHKSYGGSGAARSPLSARLVQLLTWFYEWPLVRRTPVYKAQAQPCFFADFAASWHFVVDILSCESHCPPIETKNGTKQMRLAILAIAAFIALWISLESDIESACAGNQACLAASL